MREELVVMQIPEFFKSESLTTDFAIEKNLKSEEIFKS